MNAKRIMSIVVVLVMFTASAAAVRGQDQEPDLEVADSDIWCSNFYPMRGDTVSIRTDIHNIENCYIVLRDLNSEIGYDCNLPSGKVVKVSLRARVTGPGGSVAGIQMRINNTFTSTFYVSSSSWEDVDSLGITVPLTSNDRLYVRRVTYDSGVDLEIDSIEVLEEQGTSWNSLFELEAELYSVGGGTVESIHPSNIAVSFYDGNPKWGGKFIGESTSVGNLVRITKSGTVWILTEGGTATTEMVSWTAKPNGYHFINAELTPVPRETATNNNKASTTVVVEYGGFWIISFLRQGFFPG